MPKYNPKNKQHRKTLANRVTKMLIAAGYKLDKQARSAEDVYRLDLTGVKKGSAFVRVSTSISKGEMRTVGTDSIRVYAVYQESAGKARGLVKTTNIIRHGGMQAITGRLLTAMNKTKNIAGTRANDAGFHALPVKPYAKKKWVPKNKKAGSKPKAAKRINAAVKASAKNLASSHDFKVGDLILHSSMGTDEVRWKGMVKAVSGGLITVFWFHSGKTIEFPALNLRPLVAA